MTNLNNFNNFALTTQETENVNGGRIMVVGRRVKRTTRRTKAVDTNDFTAAPIQELKQETSIENYEESLHVGVRIIL